MRMRASVEPRGARDFRGLRGTVGAMVSPWTSSASASLTGTGGIVTLVEGSAFCISGRTGNMHPHSPEGLFFRDTRFVSQLELRVNGQVPEPLAANTPDPFSGVFVLREPPAPGRPDSHLLMFRHRYVGRGMREDIVIHNFGEEPAFCSIEITIDCDFADLFEVKEGRVARAGEFTVESHKARLSFAVKRA